MAAYAHDKQAAAVFVLPAFLLYGVFVLGSIALSAYYSLFKWDGVGTMDFIGLKNYALLMWDNKDGFLQSVLNSFWIAAGSVFIQIPIAAILAMILARGIKGEAFFRSAFFLPVVVSSIVIGQLWLRIYHPAFGPLNTFLKSVGLGHWATAWTGNPNTALWAVIVPIIWQFIGFHMLILYSAAVGISKDLYEAARLDGASEIQMAWHITLPLLKPVLKISLVLAIIGSLKTFDLIYVMTGGGPVHASEVPTTLMFSTIFHKYRYGYGSAMATFMIVECLIITLLIQRVIKTADE